MEESKRFVRKIGDPVDRARKNMSVSKRARHLMNIGGTERKFGKL